MFRLGDVIRFQSIEANKVKFHLCISLDGHYLFINSPKLTSYPGDYYFRRNPWTGCLREGQSSSN